MRTTKSSTVASFGLASPQPLVQPKDQTTRKYNQINSGTCVTISLLCTNGTCSSTVAALKYSCGNLCKRWCCAPSHADSQHTVRCATAYPGKPMFAPLRVINFASAWCAIYTLVWSLFAEFSRCGKVGVCWSDLDSESSTFTAMEVSGCLQ